MATSEVRSFAVRLRTLGGGAGCAPLVDYAGTLQSHVEAHDAAALEPELARFPTLVSQIEARTV